MEFPNHCGRPMIPAWFRNRLKGFTCGECRLWIPRKESKPRRRSSGGRENGYNLYTRGNNRMPVLKRRGLLKAEDLPREGANFKILGVNESEDGVSTYDLMLKGDDGETRTLGIKPPSQNTDKLIDLFGQNTDAWAGQSVHLEPATVHVNGQTQLKIKIRAAEGYVTAGKKGK